jgi:uncharacterized membrane protein YhaH (DUF805 family)
VDLTVGVVLVAVVATFVGAIIQGAIGFGMNLVTVPALALVLPEALPVAGTLTGRRLHDLLDRGWLRPAVLAFAFVAAMIVLADALV